ncbi:MAG TPA: LLM class flavin-dependent oxidoreductase [Chloroflexota bacterium]|jgi:alkanesulfonate monooxygenase SsuD/methylene tetrahydromethanopterin reductase-like flavin-dependent oxidoreductase (luciferase family)|nr:LLM class flavin-dependent oxidoreductase [Chloroflexota bacterium]
MSARFGLVVSNRNVVISDDSASDLIALAESAECQGLSDVWVGDSLGAKPRLESIALMSAIAARTTRVRIGPACMATTPLRDPLLLAYQWSALDNIAGGRTVFVGCQGQAQPGNWPGEFEAWSFDPSTRTRRMVETIEILRHLTGEDHVTFDGEFCHFKNLTLEPRPIQRPVPIWIASSPPLNSPRNVESAYTRVATVADGWMTIGKTADEISQSLVYIRDYAKVAGRVLPSDFEACLYLNMNIDDDTEVAFEESGRFMEAYYNAPFSRGALDRISAIGPDEACAQRIQQLMQAGVTTFAIRFMSYRQPEQLERLVQEVLPRIR